MSFATADLSDADEALPSCDLQLGIFGRRRRMHGEIATISCFHDNGLIKERLSQPGEGRVLVVDGRGSLHRALVGDVIAGLAATNEWAGLIINGAIRDSALIQEMEFCVKALGTNSKKASMLGEGAIDTPVAFGGVLFRAGQHLYSDEDGIIVSPVPL